MIQQHPPTESLPASKTLENCDALMIGLRSHRVLIVHRDGPIRVWSAERLCKPLRELQPGESVYYNGNREEVRRVCVY